MSIAIGVDPGLKGAIAIWHQGLALHILSAHGTGGYARGTRRIDAATVHDAVAPLLVPGVPTLAIVETQMVHRHRVEGGKRTANTAADRAAIIAALRILRVPVVEMGAQAIDRRAGLARVTPGRAARKLEVRAFCARLVDEGRLPAFSEVPPGGRVWCDGITDAVLTAVAAAWTLGRVETRQ